MSSGIQPINKQNDIIAIHPLRNMDMANISKIEHELFEILSDAETTKFIPEKRVTTIKDVSDRIFGIVLGYETQMTYSHFITYIPQNKIIGVVQIDSPEVNKTAYELPEYNWSIEYYLNKYFWNRGIMFSVLNVIVSELHRQGVNKLFAVCNRDNTASIKILKKLGFKNIGQFDILQDCWEKV